MLHLHGDHHRPLPLRQTHPYSVGDISHTAGLLSPGHIKQGLKTSSCEYACASRENSDS